VKAFAAATVPAVTPPVATAVAVVATFARYSSAFIIWAKFLDPGSRHIRGSVDSI